MDHPGLWDNRGAVCVVDLQGHVRTLSSGWASEHGLAWRPDGKEIWFTAVAQGNSLNLMAVTLKGKLRTVLDLPMGITLQDIAPDGRVLVALETQAPGNGVRNTGRQARCRSLLARLECCQGHLARRAVRSV